MKLWLYLYSDRRVGLTPQYILRLMRRFRVLLSALCFFALQMNVFAGTITGTGNVQKLVEIKTRFELRRRLTESKPIINNKQEPHGRTYKTPRT